jgi:Domain of unknown function (DUF222)
VSAIAELRQLIDAMQAADADVPPTSASLDEIRALRRQIDRLESVWLDRVAAAHNSGAAAGEGYATTGAFLRHGCHLSPGAARSRVDVATQLTEQPAIAAAFAEGQISYHHVKVVLDAVQPMPSELRADAEPVLLEASRRHDPARVAQIARRLRYLIDPDGQAGVDARHHEQRWFEVASSFRGVGVLRGALDAESAAIVHTAIEAMSAPAGDIDPRTRAQRRADALVELARRALDAGDLPDVGGERPHVAVMVDLATLRAESPAPAELGSGNAVQPAEPIGADGARRLSCDSIVTRIVTAPIVPRGREAIMPPHYFDALPPALRGPTQPLDVGRAARTATTAIRKALNSRDKGCVMPTCDRPPPRCEAHHITHWALGGVTAVHNMALLCAFHHRFVHENGWQLAINADGLVRVEPPLAATA